MCACDSDDNPCLQIGIIPYCGFEIAFFEGAHCQTFRGWPRTSCLHPALSASLALCTTVHGELNGPAGVRMSYACRPEPMPRRTHCSHVG
jgi:hypothetical protein